MGLTPEKIKEITEAGRALGANSFILRGVREANVVFSFASVEEGKDLGLALPAPNPVLVVMCFDESDGGLEGIETA